MSDDELYELDQGRMVAETYFCSSYNVLECQNMAASHKPQQHGHTMTLLTWSITIPNKEY